MTYNKFIKLNNKMNDVYEEFMSIRENAYGTIQAQKLDMIFKKLHETPNSDLRWIWELIQNAKDAPNKFGKVKIRQILDNDFFTSSHNGNAFTMKELHSVAVQYSTKQQKNQQNVKTTGKYGTGFLTTHILSQIVTIQGILKFKKTQESESNSDEQGKNQNNLNVIYDLTKGKNKQMQNQFAQKEKRKMIESKKQLEQENGRYYYKKFDDLVLDRSYKDRDRELPKKIRLAQKKLLKIGNYAKSQTLSGANKQLIDYYENKRDQNFYDTHFKYRIQQDNKFSIVEKAVSNVKALIDYAFLFNHNLEYYEFIDQRVNDKNLSFSIQRKELKKIYKNISLFKYEISEEYDPVTQTFKNVHSGYILAKIYNGNVVAGVPIKVEDDDWKILKVNQSLSQVFKDFPLIGSSPTKWNAIINSNQFYPDETRSHLLLKTSDPNSISRIQTNQESLINCFQGIKDLYIFLADYECSGGLENLLIMDPNNQYLAGNDKMKGAIKNFIKSILDTKFIPSKRGNQTLKSKPNELCFIQSKNRHLKFDERCELSVNLNQTFAFLDQQRILLGTDLYFEFFNVLDKCNTLTYKALKQNQYIFLENCLQNLAQLSYILFYQIFKQKSFQKLHEIYGVLTKYELPIWNYSIFLNEKLQFIKFEKGKVMKKKITKSQQSLLDSFKIQFRTQLIHPAFTFHFDTNLENSNFTTQNMQILILNHFPKLNYHSYKSNDDNKNNHLHNLEQLYQILITFNQIPEVTNKNLKLTFLFRDIQPLDFCKKLTKQQKPSAQTFQSLLKVFSHNFSIYIQDRISSFQTLSSFLKYDILCIDREDEAIKYMKQLFIDKIIGSKLSTIPIKLSMDYRFIQQSQMKRLPIDMQLPNQKDIEIYQILKGQNLQKQIVLNIYPLQCLSSIRKTTYKQLYDNIQRSYNSKPDPTKLKILNYALKIEKMFNETTSVSSTVAQKYHAWKDFLKTKHKKLYQIKKQDPVFDNQQVRDYLYEMFDDFQQLKSQAQNYFKRKRQTQSVPKKNKQPSEKPQKKLKKS